MKLQLHIMYISIHIYEHTQLHVHTYKKYIAALAFNKITLLRLFWTG